MNKPVEWLADNIMPMIPFHTLEYRNNFIKFIEQAKEIEKEQIKDAQMDMVNNTNQNKFGLDYLNKKRCSRRIR